jgi:hypothetical protein
MVLYFIEHNLKRYFSCFYKQGYTYPLKHIDTTNDLGIAQVELAYEMMWEMIKMCKQGGWIVLDYILNDLEDGLSEEEIQTYKNRAIARMTYEPQPKYKY